MEDIADFFDSSTEEAIEFNKKNPARYTSKEVLIGCS